MLIKANRPISPAKYRAIITGAFVAGIAVIAVLYVLVREYGPDDSNMANGLLTGGAVGLILAAIALIVRRRRYGVSTPGERQAALIGDERADRIQTHALAVTGLISILLTTAALLAIAFGAPALPAITILLTAELVTWALAAVVLSCRV